MNRRAFLRSLIAVPVAATLPVGELVAPVTRRAALVASTRSLVTPVWVTREMARVFTEQLRGLAALSRSYDEQYVVGSTVRARLPQRWSPS